MRIWSASSPVYGRRPDCAEADAPCADGGTTSDDSAPAISTRTTCGFLTVSVPVLSKNTCETRPRFSSTSCVLMMMPALASRPVPAMYATGAAISSGHGVASTSTCANRVGSADTIHAVQAMTKEITVNGTAIRSAVLTTVARDSCAEETSSMMRWYCESRASSVARMVSVAEPLIAPDITRAPANTSRGTGSPLMLLRSSVAEPLSSSPSTGTVSPGSTMSTSPSRTWSTGTVRYGAWAISAPASSAVRASGSGASAAITRSMRDIVRASSSDPDAACAPEPTPGRSATCAICGAASISAVRLFLALSSAYASMAEPENTISTTTQLAQYSSTASVDSSATTARMSTPT